jgi:hypothetical protein
MSINVLTTVVLGLSATALAQPTEQAGTGEASDSLSVSRLVELIGSGDVKAALAYVESNGKVRGFGGSTTQRRFDNGNVVFANTLGTCVQLVVGYMRERESCLPLTGGTTSIRGLSRLSWRSRTASDSPVHRPLRGLQNP